MNWTVPFNTFSYESCFSIQETFNKQQEVCVHRVTAAQAHRYSTMGACFSACLIGGVNVGQGSCSGRPSTQKYHRDWGSNRLFSGHTTLFNQDNSTVGRLTPADVDKAGNAKRKDMKQHKQVVSTPTPLFIYFYQCLNNIDQCFCFSNATQHFIGASRWVLVFQLSESARERKVPVTRIGRLVNFGGGCVYRSCYACCFRSLQKKYVKLLN